jgi:hypothetical protein
MGVCDSPVTLSLSRDRNDQSRRFIIFPESEGVE